MKPENPETVKLLQRSLNILRNSAPTFDNDEDEEQYLEVAWALHRDLMDDLVKALKEIQL